MAGCSICKKKIERTFLNKVIGTYIKDDKGKKHLICFECQKTFGDAKQDILSKIR